MDRIPSGHSQFITTGSASRSKTPSKVQLPPNSQAHISTCGLRTDLACKLSTAEYATEMLSGDASVHLNVYNVPSVSSLALTGVSPITETLKLSLSSVTLKVYVDSSPVLTRNLGAPLIAGGKFTESMWSGRREDIVVNCTYGTRYECKMVSS